MARSSKNAHPGVCKRARLGYHFMERCRALAQNRVNHIFIEKSMTPPYTLVIYAHGTWPQKCLSMGPSRHPLEIAFLDYPPNCQKLSDWQNFQGLRVFFWPRRSNSRFPVGDTHFRRAKCKGFQPSAGAGPAKVLIFESWAGLLSNIKTFAGPAPAEGWTPCTIPWSVAGPWYRTV